MLKKGTSILPNNTMGKERERDKKRREEGKLEGEKRRGGGGGESKGGESKGGGGERGRGCTSMQGVLLEVQSRPTKLAKLKIQV